MIVAYFFVPTAWIMNRTIIPRIAIPKDQAKVLRSQLLLQPLLYMPCAAKMMKKMTVTTTIRLKSTSATSYQAGSVGAFVHDNGTQRHEVLAGCCAPRSGPGVVVHGAFDQFVQNQ